MMITYDREALGNLVRSAREDIGLSQAEVAKAVGYTSSQFLSNIERGVSVAPLPLLKRLIRHYKMDPAPIIEIMIQGEAKVLKKAFKRP